MLGFLRATARWKAESLCLFIFAVARIDPSSTREVGVSNVAAIGMFFQNRQNAKNIPITNVIGFRTVKSDSFLEK